MTGCPSQVSPEPFLNIPFSRVDTIYNLNTIMQLILQIFANAKLKEDKILQQI